ncbi:LysR family transcriptional regulator [uncultured Anaeromusa sp.]|uniref:LysR family transcriptional regulator n=1 Tax=uncultured Anaeromusa sp. TaxID=673273 RepID=UPI0029C685F1|nr:LysR family transcriptional regulator [uncultured Anaeromusa sp.]
MLTSKYYIFSTIAELGSLSKAADKLSMAQSGVSYAISTLESELGFALFKRERSGMRLTPNGERILVHVKQILHHEEQLYQESLAIKGIETGLVRIGTLSSVSMQWLPGILASFHKDYPQIEVKTYLGCYDEMNDWISNKTIDFGFVSLPISKAFEVRPLYKDRLQVILPPQHSLRQQKSITFSQIRNEQFIMPQWGADDNIRRMLLENGVQLQVQYELMEERTILAMVQLGLGISILPELILEHVPPDVHLIPLEPEEHRIIGLAALSFKQLPPAAKKFVQCAHAWLAAKDFLTFTDTDE